MHKEHKHSHDYPLNTGIQRDPHLACFLLVRISMFFIVKYLTRKRFCVYTFFMLGKRREITFYREKSFKKKLDKGGGFNYNLGNYTLMRG